jgi:hypothetical protein
MEAHHLNVVAWAFVMVEVGAYFFAVQVVHS